MSTLHQILLQPTDVLFFRDGRPMTGSLAGHGAAWPLPHVINAAFHAALHRSGFAQDAHSHRRGGRGVYASDAERDRKFGSLTTAGPFPVKDRQTWFFPRPQDLQDATLQPALLPAAAIGCVPSSLPHPLRCAVANRRPPTKESGAKTWLSRQAFETYLGTTQSAVPATQLSGHALEDSDLFDCEHTIGIGIDPETGSADGQSYYSAHYLRLRDNWQLGVCAAAEDKAFSHPQHKNDLVQALFNGGQHQITVGGQQRICSAASVAGTALPLPRGRTGDFREHDGKFLVKWILLTPAVWPTIAADAARHINAQPGGWLPNWIDPQTGAVLLKAGDTARHERESREAWRQRVRQQGSISAKLVAALVPKPLVVSGWALPDEAAGELGGARSTHLAVPAGAVYYLEATTKTEAENLAAALNWHGRDNQPTTIKNRRSTLLGEKGYGLGVCGTWSFFPEAANTVK